MMNKQPRAMMTSAAATLREVWSRQKVPRFFLQAAWVIKATDGSTDDKLSRLIPHVGAPYEDIADCTASRQSLLGSGVAIASIGVAEKVACKGKAKLNG